MEWNCARGFFSECEHVKENAFDLCYESAALRRRNDVAYKFPSRFIIVGHQSRRKRMLRETKARVLIKNVVEGETLRDMKGKLLGNGRRGKSERKSVPRVQNFRSECDEESRAMDRVKLSLH